ncbi:DUF726 domain-containing protein [Fodinibius salsisoli]|uniref:Alpha/beta hydrolase n=1 Tax=Fodinibius salsisoli TaxID=2820877 RepID=A0ABT3PPH3_9BACT|nr:DUF726 domain-containing protein [Fodinibius salsisoli]MCW9707736.1 alpha/beta hydrolase [Fodinibius salsisoli]
MYLINLRSEGSEGNTFSKFEQINSYNSQQMEAVEQSDLRSAIGGKNILLIIHGFNNSMDDILSLYEHLDDQCNTFFSDSYHATIGFVWPSGESEFSYFQSKENAKQAGTYLRDWLHQFTQAGCTIDVMGHSMATIVGYNALQSSQTINIRNVFSLGAAVSQSYLVERITANMMEKVQNLYLFYTKRDDVLRYWFRLVEWEEAIGYSGLEKYEKLLSYFQQLTLIDCSNIVHTHTGYWDSKVVFECMSNILDGKQYPRSYKLLPGLRNVFDRFLTSGDPPENKLIKTSDQ